MRLTLRTLLAYLDGILEPEDAEDLRKKIEESEFATDLLHRTRDVMRRLRLAAPGLTDHEQGLDANTVAEYLDNTLHSGRVPDFERICLESDAHLAEVASCHQILTLVLGEPAEIEPVARQRMYQLLGASAASTQPWSNSEAAEVDSGLGESGRGAGPPKPPRQRPTVPEYLRESPKKRRLLPAAIALALTVCVAVVGLGLAGQFERESWLVSRLLGPASAEIADRSGRDALPNEEEPSAEPTTPNDTAPSDAPPADVTPDNVPPIDAPPADVAPDVTPATDAPSGDSPPNGVPPVNPTLSEVPDVQPPVDGTVPEGPTTDGTQPDGAPAGDAPPVEPEPVPPGPAGRLVSDREVLLRLDSASGTWQRVPAQGVVASQERLTVLPTCRPKISCSAGVAQLLGGTEVEWVANDATGIAGLHVKYGRVLITPPAEAGTQLRLTFGERAGVITFADAESMVALEATAVGVPGTDPRTENLLKVARLYTTRQGHVLWDEAGGQQTVEGGSCLMLDDQPLRAPVAVKELPEWTGLAPLGSLEEQASTKLEEVLSAGGSTELALREMADHRKREFRWLGARCLGYIGEFGPLVVGLNDPENMARWPNWETHYLAELLAALGRSPETAQHVHDALSRHFGDEADNLFRMLCGYTDEGLAGGDDVKLVEGLDHKILAVRRLSIWNLKGITGLGLHYEPGQTAAKRKTSVQKWNDRLAQQQIRFRLSADNPEPPPAAEVQP